MTSRIVVSLLVATTMTACVRQPYVPRETLNRIIVTPGDVSRPYRIVGTVEWPGAGYISPTDCDPDHLKKEAVSRYGQVDAIIGYLQWQDGRMTRCSGTAVTFTGQ